jgi:hypothetical protein
MTMKAAVFWIITSIALLVSANATYELLTTISPNYIALAAAVVIDAAAIWLGWHATDLAKKGAYNRSVTISTWFVICISLSINFFHGYVDAGWAGAILGIAFPLIAAILYEHYIKDTIYDVRFARGEILPRKPVWLKSKDYGNTEEDKQLEQDYVSLTRDRARYEMRLLRDSFSPVVLSQDTEIDLPLEGEIVSPAIKTTQDTDRTATGQDETETGLAGQVDHVFAAQMLRDINETMTIKEIIEVLVGQGVQDYKQLQDKVSEVKGQPVKIETIRKTASRVIKTNETGSETS